MAHFIALTEYRRHTRQTLATVVNLDQVTHMSTEIVKFPAQKRWDGGKTGAVEVAPEENISLTTISFAVGMHEETEAIWVLESLEEIKRLVHV